MGNVFAPLTRTLRQHRESSGAPSPLQLEGYAKGLAAGGPRFGTQVTGQIPTPGGRHAQPAGAMVQQGNIDLSRRPIAVNGDGSVSTIRSLTIDDDSGNTILIPSVVGGRVVSNEDAIAHYQRTGQHLGIFNDPNAAEQYSQVLHLAEARRMFGPQYEDEPVRPSLAPKAPAANPVRAALMQHLMSRRNF